MQTISRQQMIGVVEETGLSASEADFLVSSLLAQFPMTIFLECPEKFEEILSSGECLNFTCLSRKSLVPHQVSQRLGKESVEKGISAIEILISEALEMDYQVEIEGMGTIKAKPLVVWSLTPSVEGSVARA